MIVAVQIARQDGADAEVSRGGVVHTRGRHFHAAEGQQTGANSFQ